MGASQNLICTHGCTHDAPICTHFRSWVHKLEKWVHNKIWCTYAMHLFAPTMHLRHTSYQIVNAGERLDNGFHTMDKLAPPGRQVLLKFRRCINQKCIWTIWTSSHGAMDLIPESYGCSKPLKTLHFQWGAAYQVRVFEALDEKNLELRISYDVQNNTLWKPLGTRAFADSGCIFLLCTQLSHNQTAHKPSQTQA